MCRARPGPRCSNTGTKRYNNATKHLAYIQSRYDSESQNDARPTARRTRQLANAKRRLEAAKRVFFGTPSGQDYLQDSIELAEDKLKSLPKGRAGTQERDNYNKVIAERDNLVEEKALGHSRRSISYSDLHLAGRERRALRDEARARGGQMDSRAHPMSEARKAGLAPADAESLTLKEWNEQDVARADSWVEAGANPGWTENNSVRPPKKASGVEVGAEKVAPSTSRLVRLNTPDGQVVEARYDFHLTKNDDGKYFVTSRALVASSWEDASPIDVTTQNLGHIITSRSGVTKKESKTLIGEFSSEKQAQAALKKAKKSCDKTYVKTTALTARTSIMARSKRTDKALQERGIVKWFRYEE